MYDILVVIIWFFIALTIHTFLHRRVRSHQNIALMVSLIYFLGIPLLVYVQAKLPLIDIHLPISAGFIVLLYSLYLILFYSYQFLEEKSSSSLLYAAFSENQIMKKKQIIHSFSDESIIDARLKKLEKQGLIRNLQGVYTLTIKGRLCFILLKCLCFVSGMEVGG